jgi:hypothetical protein
VPLPRRNKLTGLLRQPQKMTTPVEVTLAPVSIRFKIIGAVDSVRPFPIATSPEATSLQGGPDEK